MSSNFASIIKACEEASGAGTKKIIVSALQKADPTALRLIREAQDPYRIYGVRQISMPTQYPDSTQPKAYNELFTVLDSLAARQLTGNTARSTVSQVLSLFSEEEAGYIIRIIDKDLKSGFSSETVNKLYPGLIPAFDVMLADKCDDAEDFEKNISFPLLAETKLDGERTIVIVKADSVVYYSRSGKIAAHVNGLFDGELSAIHKIVGDFALDGERYASNFTETMNAKKSNNDLAKSNLKFYAFFLMPLADWIAQKTSITMRENKNSLSSILFTAKCKKILMTEGREVVDYHDMMSYCDEVIDVKKFEGLIAKNWDSPYLWKRDKAWTKIKRFSDADCRIVGFYAGRPKSRLENTLGGIEIVGLLESGERVEARVGSGFSDELRGEIWNNQQSWLGKTVVIKYQEVSRSKSKQVASLRFPTFERARDPDDKQVDID